MLTEQVPHVYVETLRYCTKEQAYVEVGHFCNDGHRDPVNERGVPLLDIDAPWEINPGRVYLKRWSDYVDDPGGPGVLPCDIDLSTSIFLIAPDTSFTVEHELRQAGWPIERCGDTLWLAARRQFDRYLRSGKYPIHSDTFFEGVEYRLPDGTSVTAISSWESEACFLGWDMVPHANPLLDWHYTIWHDGSISLRKRDGDRWVSTDTDLTIDDFQPV